MRSVILACLLLSASMGSIPLVSAQEKRTISFKDSDIVEVINYVSEFTGKTMVIDPRVKGKVTVVSRKPLTADGVYDLFLSILDVQGFTAVESNGVVRIMQNKKVRSSAIPVVKSGGAKPRGGDNYVTEVVVLRNISAAKVLPVLRPLIAQHAHMAAYDPSNSIVMTDTAANIERVKQVIRQIDRAAVAQTEVIQLEFAQAEEAVKMLNKLMDGGTGNKTAGSLKLVADGRTNSIIVGGDQLQRNRVKGLVARLDRPQAQTGNVRVIYLEYAKSVEVAKVLSKLLKNIDRPGGKKGSTKSTSSIEADEATNSLLITAEGDTLKSLLQVVERLDIRRAQVLVEAVIAEIEHQDGKDLGIQWLFADEQNGFGSFSAGDNSLAGVGREVLDTNNNNIVRNLGAAIASVPGTVLGFGELDDNRGFLGLINALQTNQNSNILSTPSLLTTDNHEASFAVGQEVPIVTGSFTNTGGNGNPTNPFQTVDRQNVGISLKVTPHVNEGDRIILDIEQEVSSLTGESGPNGPTTNERTIQTQVLSADGQVVILGGLMRDDVQKSESRVPVLGRIPVMGRLFRRNNDRVRKTNLLLFIRATVIRDDEKLSGTTAEKYRYLREEQLRQRKVGNFGLSKELIPVVPEWPVAPNQDLSGYGTKLDELEAQRARHKR